MQNFTSIIALKFDVCKKKKHNGAKYLTLLKIAHAFNMELGELVGFR